MLFTKIDSTQRQHIAYLNETAKACAAEAVATRPI